MTDDEVRDALPTRDLPITFPALRERLRGRIEQPDLSQALRRLSNQGRAGHTHLRGWYRI